MHPCILPVYYFGPIAYYGHWVQSEKVVLEKQDHYQKQTYRNRAYIYGVHGKLRLSVPIKHQGVRSYKEVRISYEYPWIDHHIKSVKTLYQSSAYYEFYEEDLLLVLNKKENFLMDLNWKCAELIANLLEIPLPDESTISYQKSYADQMDLRGEFELKKQEVIFFPEYHQVFVKDYGFMKNLSVLDLLFNKGPESLDYLKGLELQK